jgi:hypothetical protein
LTTISPGCGANSLRNSPPQVPYSKALRDQAAFWIGVMRHHAGRGEEHPDHGGEDDQRHHARLGQREELLKPARGSLHVGAEARNAVFRGHTVSEDFGRSPRIPLSPAWGANAGFFGGHGGAARSAVKCARHYGRSGSPA